jgi:hypothetical protein
MELHRDERRREQRDRRSPAENPPLVPATPAHLRDIHDVLASNNECRFTLPPPPVSGMSNC